MNMAAKKLPVQYSFPAFEGVNNLLQQNMPLLEPFFGFWVVLGWGSTDSRLKASSNSKSCMVDLIQSLGIGL